MPVRKCPKCKDDITCRRCDGNGFIAETIMGVVVNKKPCTLCHETGKQRNHRCRKSGIGVVPRIIQSGGDTIIGNNNKVIRKK
jgi:DnaJ-class molecular chaperone